MSQEYRLRVAYAKADRGAWLSHLEVLHTLDRVVRRAALPYAITQGFNKHMKLQFGTALSVGVGSEREYLDVSLTKFVEPDVALARLQKAATPVLPVLEVGYVPLSQPALTAVISLVEYRATIVALDIDVVELENAFQSVRAQESLEVEQKGKLKVFDPAVCIPNDAHITQVGDTTEIVFTIRISQTGSLRPDALISSVLARAGVPDARFLLTRIDSFVETAESGVVRLL